MRNTSYSDVLSYYLSITILRDCDNYMNLPGNNSWWSRKILWLKFRGLHRDYDKPAVINFDERNRIRSEEWYKKGKRH